MCLDFGPNIMDDPKANVDRLTAMLETNRLVEVTAADWNGTSWDGSPFNPTPKWVVDVVSEGKVQMLVTGHDYVVWNVKTDKGMVLAEPGDVIRLNLSGSLSVLKEAP